MAFLKDRAYLNGLDNPIRKSFPHIFLAASDEPVGVVKL